MASLRRFVDAEGGTRTRTARRPPDFKSGASDQFRHPGGRSVALRAGGERPRLRHDERWRALGDHDLLVRAQNQLRGIARDLLAIHPPLEVAAIAADAR